MVLLFPDGSQIRGDLILRSALRYDMVPVPVTLEADFKADDSVLAQLKEGSIITTGTGERMQVVYCKPVRGGVAQGDKLQMGVRVVAFLEDCAQIAFARSRAIIKYNQTLLSIFKAAGCKLRGVESDLPVPRFVCMVGDTPSVGVSRVLQEAGGVLRWKGGRLSFLRIHDLMRQAPVITLPNLASDDTQSEYLERHEIPAFFSLSPAGQVIHGNRVKTRASMFAPHQDQASLHNMTRVLVKRKEVRTQYSANLRAGDVVNFTGGLPHVILTACHYHEAADGPQGVAQDFTKLWCARPME